MDVLVIGLGNRDRGDDAAGLAAADELLSRAPAGVRIARHEGEATGLLELWRGADAVVLIDAVSSGAAPGTVRRFEAGRTPLPTRPAFRSGHALRPGTAIELARALGRLPPLLLVYGVEGAGYDLGAAHGEAGPITHPAARPADAGLSPAVRAALPGLIERVMSDLRDMTAGGDPHA